MYSANAYHHPPAEAKAELTTPDSGRVDDDVWWHGASLILKQVANFRTKVNIQSYSSE
jgi:hypothetical protein